MRAQLLRRARRWNFKGKYYIIYCAAVELNDDINYRGRALAVGRYKIKKYRNGGGGGGGGGGALIARYSPNIEIKHKPHYESHVNKTIVCAVIAELIK